VLSSIVCFLVACVCLHWLALAGSIEHFGTVEQVPQYYSIDCGRDKIRNVASLFRLLFLIDVSRQGFIDAPIANIRCDTTAPHRTEQQHANDVAQRKVAVRWFDSGELQLPLFPILSFLWSSCAHRLLLNLHHKQEILLDITSDVFSPCINEMGCLDTAINNSKRRELTLRIYPPQIVLGHLYYRAEMPDRSSQSKSMEANTCNNEAHNVM
jgi:hypothetical protein